MEAEDYERAKQAFREHKPVIELSTADLVELRVRLDQEKTYLLSLLGNQALLEHEKFTDLLWAVTHLAEELHARGDFDHLPDADRAHLVVDVKRAYTLLGVQWIDYLRTCRRSTLPVLARRPNEPARPKGERDGREVTRQHEAGHVRPSRRGERRRACSRLQG